MISLPRAICPRYLLYVTRRTCMYVLSHWAHTHTILTCKEGAMAPLWSLASHSVLCWQTPETNEKKEKRANPNKPKRENQTSRLQIQENAATKPAEPRRVSSRTPIPKSSTFVCEARSVKKKTSQNQVNARIAGKSSSYTTLVAVPGGVFESGTWTSPSRKAERLMFGSVFRTLLNLCRVVAVRFDSCCECCWAISVMFGVASMVRSRS
jgi:hypothetical protein